MKKISKLQALLLSALLHSCQSAPQKVEAILPDSVLINSPLELTKESKGSGFSIARTSPQIGQKEIELAQDIRIDFSEEIEPTSVNETTLLVYCLYTKRFLPGKTQVLGHALEFTLERKFLERASDTEPGATWSGLRPDSRYRVFLKGDVRSRAGTPLAKSSIAFEFSTVKADSGLYWIGPDGSYEKAVKGETSRFFDPKKPVVLYLPGWQKTTTGNNFFRENPFVYSGQYFGSGSSTNHWHESGFNIAVFFWNQISDEEEVQDAEKKIWIGDGAHKAKDGKPLRMRYRLRDGTYEDSKTQLSVADQVLQEYLYALRDFKGQDVRVVGHSLGAQLTTRFLYLLSEKIEKEKLSPDLFPKRVALLDPFWSRGKKKWLENRWTGEVSRNYVFTLLEKHNFAFEFVKTSVVGGHLVGDRNIGLREKAAYYRVESGFIPFYAQDYKHWYAYVWYANGIKREIKTPEGFRIGPSASDDEIKKAMNANRAEPVTWILDKGIKSIDQLTQSLAHRQGVD